MSLLDLPVDVWQTLSRYLFFWHFMRLYECGSRRLIEIMTVRGGVTDSVMIFSGTNVTLDWFPRISDFANLRLFVFDCGGVVDGIPFYPTANDLKLLPKTIKHFHFHSDSAEEAFYLNLVGENRDNASSYIVGNLLNISSLWPELVTFDIIQYSPNTIADLRAPEFSVPLVKTLPASVVNLTIRNCDSSDEELFKTLSRDLLYLKVENTAEDIYLHPESFQHLPPRLETYISVPYTRKLPPVPELSQWGEMPRSLTFLCLFIYEQAPPELIGQLPPNLTFLNLGHGIQPASYSAVASTLPKLRALVVNDRSPSDWDKDYIGTMHLRHISRVSGDFVHGANHHFTFDAGSETWLLAPYENHFQHGGGVTLFN
jgi:hypothetical protein